MNGFEIFWIEGDILFVYRDKFYCDFFKGGSNILKVYILYFIIEFDD